MERPRTSGCPACSSPAARHRFNVQRGVIESALTALCRSPVHLEPGWTQIQLWRCRRCELEYFLPQIAGDSAFYALLDRTTSYYEPDRWDMRRALEQMQPGSRVLDLGCGAGALLRAANRRGATAVGVDGNGPALEALKADGCDVRVGELTNLDAAEYEDFDVVTLLHVLEHVPDPRRLMQSAAGFVRPGGRVVVAVPDRRRIPLEDLEPLDLPPHHLTRWNATCLTALARRVGLTPEWVRTEPLEPRQAFRHARGRATRRTGISRLRYWVSPTQPPQGSVVTRILRGQSLVGVFKRC